MTGKQETSKPRDIKAGDKARDTATRDAGKVGLGDGGAPSFDPATKDAGKVRLGDGGIGAF
jgi:hypothetical protein